MSQSSALSSGRTSPRRSAWRYSWQLALLMFLLSTTVSAQENTEKEKPRPPEDVAIKTSDDVTLTATYYPSKRGKDAAVVILIHDDGGKRSELDRLARRLQLGGSAVIVPDLRGHGDSTGDFTSLRAEDYQAMVRRDLEAVKGFLMERNNRGELNIERLGVIGVHMGATLAVDWAALDWSWPELATGKQGQDVKAIGLISPEWSYKGMRIGEALAEPGVQEEISVITIVGRRNNKFYSEAKRLHNAFARHHEVAATLPVEQKTLFFEAPPTTLQGMLLLNEKSLDVEGMLEDFVDLRLKRPALVWQMRRSAFSNH